MGISSQWGGPAALILAATVASPTGIFSQIPQ